MRIVVLTYDSHQSRRIVARVVEARPGDVVGVLASSVTVPGRRGVATASFLLRRTGLGFVARKGVEIALSRTLAWWAWLRGRVPAVPSLRAVARVHGIPLVRTRDVNGAETRDMLARWRPDLLVSVHMNQRVRPETMAVAPLGAINVHGADLPRYRGLFPYFWVLANGERETGVTVHWMDKDFDTGDIVVQRRFPIAGDDTVFSLAEKGARAGAELLVEALDLIAGGAAPRHPQDARAASYYSWPTPEDVKRLRRRGHGHGSVRSIWRGLHQ